MTLECDAAFLAGVLVGTYDLRGDAQPPEYIRPFLDRVLKPAEAKSTVAATLPVKFTPPVPEFVLPELTQKMLDKANGTKAAPAPKPTPPYDVPGPVIMGEPQRNSSLDDDGDEPDETDQLPPAKKTRKPWSPEARAAAAQRMRDRIASGKIKPGRHPRSHGIAATLAAEDDSPGEEYAPSGLRFLGAGQP